MQVVPHTKPINHATTITHTKKMVEMKRVGPMRLTGELVSRIVGSICDMQVLIVTSGIIAVPTLVVVRSCNRKALAGHLFPYFPTHLLLLPPTPNQKNKKGKKNGGCV